MQQIKEAMAEFCPCCSSATEAEPVKAHKQLGKEATRNAIIKENN